MIRWELYVNFFYSWIVFSLRCHQLNFQYYSEMNIYHWVTALERSAGKNLKRKPNPNSFSSPSFCSSEHAELPLVSKATQHPCAPGYGLWALQVSLWVPVGPGGLRRVKRKGKSLQEQWEKWYPARFIVHLSWLRDSSGSPLQKWGCWSSWQVVGAHFGRWSSCKVSSWCCEQKCG